MINKHKYKQTQSPATNIMTVFEHQRLTTHDFAHDADFQWLITQELSVFSIQLKQGQWQLKVGHYIGVIVLPSGMTLEILPKIISHTASNSTKQSNYLNKPLADTDILQTRHWVQNMLSDLMGSNDHKLPHSKNFGQYSEKLTTLPLVVLPLSDWLIEQFLQQLAHYQPTKHYQTQVHNQAALQGRLLIKEQLRHNSMQPHKFVCESSVLSQDMLGNRMIKSALKLLMLSQSSFLHYLQPWQHVSELHKHQIQQLQSIVQQAKHELAIQPLQASQLQAALHLVDLAYWLLSQSNMEAGQSIDSPKPANNTFTRRLCLLIDMNQAFEQWASQRIALFFQQQSNGYQPLFQAQRVWLNDAEGQACLSIRPDLLIYRQLRSNAENTGMNDDVLSIKDLEANASAEKQLGHYSHVSHVIDIKWKHLANASAIAASDAYQLSSYAQAYQAEQVWLVYPVQDNQRQAEALRQQSHPSSSYNQQHNNIPTHAQLWLVPFNVLTGCINSDLLLA